MKVRSSLIICLIILGVLINMGCLSFFQKNKKYKSGVKYYFRAERRTYNYPLEPYGDIEFSETDNAPYRGYYIGVFDSNGRIYIAENWKTESKQIYIDKEFVNKMREIYANTQHTTFYFSVKYVNNKPAPDKEIDMKNAKEADEYCKFTYDPKNDVINTAQVTRRYLRHRQTIFYHENGKLKLIKREMGDEKGKIDRFDVHFDKKGKML